MQARMIQSAFMRRVEGCRRQAYGRR
jgi:hypothetical protein